MSATGGGIPDESELVPQPPSLAGTRCRDCRHFFPCEFLDEAGAARDLGAGAFEVLAAEYGMCEVDSPALVRGDHLAWDAEGYDCWEQR